jgi:diguanylate cyclase (GGDEF)-like protein
MEKLIRRTTSRVEKILSLSAPTAWVLFLFILVGVEYVDYVTGPELDVCFLLMFPTFVLAWRFGLMTGLMAAFLCSLSSLILNYSDRLIYTHPSIAWLNTITLFIFLIIFAAVVHALRVEMKYRERLARTDPLTGLLNRRAFDEAIRNEMNRLARFKRPFTLMFLDLDKFKWVNDTKGHAAGDELLKSVARVLVGSLREIDSVARFGGDEFAVLLPETDAEAALSAITNLERNLKGMALGAGFPVSASIGWVTNKYPPLAQEELFEEADRRMYLDKTRKQNIEKSQDPGSPATPSNDVPEVLP